MFEIVDILIAPLLVSLILVAMLAGTQPDSWTDNRSKPLD